MQWKQWALSPLLPTIVYNCDFWLIHFKELLIEIVQHSLSLIKKACYSYLHVEGVLYLWFWLRSLSPFDCFNGFTSLTSLNLKPEGSTNQRKTLLFFLSLSFLSLFLSRTLAVIIFLTRKICYFSTKKKLYFALQVYFILLAVFRFFFVFFVFVLCVVKKNNKITFSPCFLCVCLPLPADQWMSWQQISHARTHDSWSMRCWVRVLSWNEEWISL